MQIRWITAIAILLIETYFNQEGQVDEAKTIVYYSRYDMVCENYVLLERIWPLDPTVRFCDRGVFALSSNKINPPMVVVPDDLAENDKADEMMKLVKTGW